jgi:AcrR family transcriptional regulator
VPKERGRANATSARRALRRQALLDAAVEVIRDEGPDASMDRIAAACGVTKPIIYRHFGDRAGLIEAIGLQFVSGLVFDLAVELRGDRPPQELIRRVIDTYVRHIEADAGVYRFLIQEAPQGGIQFLGAIVAEEVAKLLGTLLDREGDPALVAWAYGLVGMVHFAGDWWAYGRPMSRRQLVEELASLAWGGLASLGIDPDGPASSTTSTTLTTPTTSPRSAGARTKRTKGTRR